MPAAILPAVGATLFPLASRSRTTWNKGALIGVRAGAGSENLQGETQKKLDIITTKSSSGQ